MFSFRIRALAEVVEGVEEVKVTEGGNASGVRREAVVVIMGREMEAHLMGSE